MQKYDTKPTTILLTYGWIQLAFTLGLMLWLFNHITQIAAPELFIYGAFLFLSVHSYTTLLDQSKWSLWMEVTRFLFGITLLIVDGGDWYGLRAWWSSGPYLIGLVLTLSLGFVLYHQMRTANTANVQIHAH
jgi:hypothetical protein